MFQLSKRRLNISSFNFILLAINQSIAQHGALITIETVSNLFCGLNCLVTPSKRSNEYLSSPYVRQLLQEIFVLISKRKTEKFSAQGVGRALYGFNHFHGRSDLERGLISELSRFLNATENIQLDDHSIEDALCGIQTLDTSVPDVRILLNEFSKFLDCSIPINLSRKTILLLSFSLRNLSGQYAEERRFLQCISKHLKHSDINNLPSESIASLVYGLYRFRSKSSEFYELVTIITHILNTNAHIVFRTNYYSQILFGLQNFSARNSVEDQLISVVSKLNSSTTEAISPIYLSNLIYGFNEMTGSCPSEATLLAKVTAHILEAKELIVDEDAMCNILRAIVSLDRDRQEVRSCFILFHFCHYHVYGRLSGERFDTIDCNCRKCC